MKGAIFDMDGTLLDSMGMWASFGERFLRGLGIEPPGELSRILGPMTLFEGSVYLKERFGLPQSAQELTRRQETLLMQQYCEEISPKPGVFPLLERLKKQGVRMCVATATDRLPAAAALERLELAPYFDFLLTCPEVGRGKEYPDIFEHALARLGTSLEETVVFEDALYAVRTAKKAGFRVCAVEDGSAWADADQIRLLADWYLPHVGAFGPLAATV